MFKQMHGFQGWNLKARTLWVQMWQPFILSMQHRMETGELPYSPHIEAILDQHLTPDSDLGEHDLWHLRFCMLHVSALGHQALGSKPDQISPWEAWLAHNEKPFSEFKDIMIQTLVRHDSGDLTY
jgi:hypothetical protein